MKDGIFRGFCGLVVATFLNVSLAQALPKTGTPAPSLRDLQLLQAPGGAQADWKIFQGKVVVLEFWATWCGPCVAAIPHLNQLVASVDPAKVQFISVDDEDQKVVESFLAKKKMAGWVGLDAKGTVFNRYGVESRPTTIIVDKSGRVAELTKIEDLTAQDLIAIADRKDVKFAATPVAPVVPADGGTQTAGSKTVFEVSLSQAAPNTKRLSEMSGNGDMRINGVSAESLLTYAYGVPSDRLMPSKPLPDTLYNLHEVFAGADSSVKKQILQAAVSAGLHVRVQPAMVTKDAYVLKAADGTKKLPESVGTHSMVDYYKGKIQIVKGSMEDLAYELEVALGVPVTNETGLEGTTDVDLEIAKGDIASAKDALQKMLGLELQQASRPIKMLTVESLPEHAKE